VSVDLLVRSRDLMATGRAEEARTLLDAAVKAGKADADVHSMLGYAAYHAGRIGDAEKVLEAGLRVFPAAPALHEALARMRWMNGAGERFADNFLAAVAANPKDMILRLKCAELLRLAEMPEPAERLLREALKVSPGNANVQAWLATLLDEKGRPADAEAMLRESLRTYPQDPSLRLNLAHALMRQGRPDAAMTEIETVRKAYPDQQLAITYQATAMRQIGDPRYGWLCDYDRHLKVFDLDPPPGFSTIAEFNAALSDVLLKMHDAPAHPLEQSLRGGSQTSDNLIHLGDPLIKLYFSALARRVSQYIESLGRDREHPLESRRAASFTFSGCWSVRLRSGGFHVNHTHPNGWISSSYYVSLPASVSAESQEGWIKFGEPRWPIPGCGIERIVQPKEGRLVLFPSYMWHGTIPFSSGERLTAPFDVVPVGAPV
jgi:tetratricopeptide (TPR) repeat protein